jgi:hypothetical protein
VLLFAAFGNKVKTSGPFADGGNGWIRQRYFESPVAVLTGAFGHFHLIAIGKPVSHDVLSCVTINAPKAFFGMDIPGEVVKTQTVCSGFRFPFHQRRPECIVVIMFKKSFIVSAYMVLVMTVKALHIGYSAGQNVSYGVPGS